MSKRRVAIAIGLLLALAVGYKLYDRSKDKAARGEGSGGESGSSESESERIERARARKAEQASAPRGTLGGIVIDSSSGAPIPGAVVSMGRTSFELGGRLNPGEAKAPVITTTGEDGRFRLPAIRAGELSVTASAAGYLPVSKERLALASGEDRSDIKIALTRGGNQLTGVVSDVGGGPIGGAYVSAQRISEGTISTFFRAPVTAFTDPEGRYALTLASGNYVLQAGHADYTQKQRMTEMVGSDRSEDFSLVPGAVISGRVLVAGTEKPVAGATVTPAVRGGRITGAVFLAGARTGADGRFVLSGLKSGEVSLIAVAPNYSSRTPKTVVVGIAEQRTEVTIYVDDAYTISGFVVSREEPDKPIPRVMVGAYNIGKRSAAVTSDPSAGDGYFQISGVLPGTYTIGAAGEGLLPEFASQTVEVKDKDIDGLRVEVGQGMTIRGRVEPAVAAYVRLEIDMDSFSPLAIPRMIGSQLARTTADENGQFELTGLSSGKYTIVAEHLEKGAGRSEVELSHPGLFDAVVELEPTGSISGTVVDAQGRPVSRARVRAGGGGRSAAIGFGSSFGDWNSAISDETGAFKVRGLDSGSYRLSVRKDGQRLEWAGATIAAATGKRNKRVEVELDKSENRTGVALIVETMDGKITGKVLDGAGEAVPDAWVKLGLNDGSGIRRGPRGRRVQEEEEENEDNIETDDPLFTRLTPALTDADGEFSFKGLRAGEYWVSATGPRGDAVGTVRPIKSGGRVTIVLESMGSTSGVVTSGGAPVTEYTLKVEGPRLVRLPVANETGSYIVERLPSGRYQFQIQSEAGRARKSVVIDGKPLVVNFEIEPYSDVTGTVVGVTTGKPLAGRAVFAVSEGSDTDAIGQQLLTGDVPTTDADGKFSVTRQGVGKATVIVIDALAGISPIGEASVELEQGQTVDAGIIYAVDDPLVPSDLRGRLGLETVATTFAKRPNPEDGASAPPGSKADDKFLWVADVTEGGAAEAAGVKKGDRIVLIDAIDLAVVGPEIGPNILRPDRNGVGKKRTLTIDRLGESLVIEVTARAAP